MFMTDYNSQSLRLHIVYFVVDYLFLDSCVLPVPRALSFLAVCTPVFIFYLVCVL